ncbi:sensor histidine kinase [Kineosporia sp. A_224]|uniref:sensor histidine kinase n=1 Tax=Kineosporia sp. A_224 TaxID=1962180 RepID=UPI0013045D54|nr:histidine kinase [Kineosporia sp. A_224]
MRTRWQTLLAEPRTVDAAVVLGCLVLTVLAVRGAWSGLPAAVIVPAGVGGSAAQWLRRRHPQVAAIAGAASYTLSGNPGPLLAGLYAGGAYAPRRRAWLTATVGAAGQAGWAWVDAGRLTASDAAFSVVGAVVVVAVGVHAATRRDLEASLEDRAERVEAERVLRDQQARSAERTRIAREMHDVLAHQISLIALHAGALEVAAGDDPERTRDGAALIRGTAREALRDLRTVLGVLTTEPLPAAAPDGAPFADLGDLVEASTRAGQQVELQDHGGRLPPAVARVVHRVAQEGLTNARKHAPGAPVVVRVEGGDGTEGGDDTEGLVTVTVTNDAASRPALDLPGAGAGLLGLAERVRLADGSLESGPREGGGWQLRVVLPRAGSEDAP